jgi:RNA polymerase primary sigma factor
MGRRLTRQAAATARLVRARDFDHQLRKAALKELERLCAGDSPTGSDHAFRTDSRAFGSYLQHVRALEAASRRARDSFIQRNLRLVITIACRHDYGLVPLGDLIQEGNLGLIKAIGRFDHRRGFRFSTYAGWWIRHAITRAIADKGRLVRVPVCVLEELRRVERSGRELSASLGRPPTVEELGRSTGLGVERVDELQQRASSPPLLLDSTVSNPYDRQSREQSQATAAGFERHGDVQVFQQALELFGDLRPLEADVLRKRFGLLDGEEHTLRDIGEGYGLSRERIRQIQQAALDKLRHWLVERRAL